MSINKVPGEKMSKELRSESRLIEKFTIFVETYSSPEGDQDPDSIRVTKTIDVSTKGLQIELDTRVPVSSVLQLYIQGSDRSRKFLLTGEVRWTYQAEPYKHFIGFRLLDASHTDNEAWQDYITERLRMAS